MKRALSLLLAASLSLSLVACGGGGGSASGSAAPEGSGSASNESQTPTQQIIQEAQGMTLEELAQKAIEESNGKTFYGVGNSSRGKSALPLFIEYLQSIDPSYSMEFEWQQPKNNKIFDQLTADSLKDTGTFAMTLIQDGNQIESKMVQTGILDTFIPKDWADANGTTADAYTGFLPLQTLNKVFMYNCTGDKTYDNCWDFVAEGEHGLYMDIDSEIVGKNFLYMLTRDDYSAMLKEAFEALSAEEQALRVCDQGTKVSHRADAHEDEGRIQTGLDADVEDVQQTGVRQDVAVAVIVRAGGVQEGAPELGVVHGVGRVQIGVDRVQAGEVADVCKQAAERDADEQQRLEALDNAEVQQHAGDHDHDEILPAAVCEEARKAGFRRQL